MLLNHCTGTACLRRRDGVAVWSESFRDECCADSLHVTRDGDVIYPTADGHIVVRSVEGVPRLRSRGTKHFIVGADGSLALYYEQSRGFTGLSLPTGEVLGRIEFRLPLRAGRFDSSHRRSLLAILDDSGDSEQIVMMETRTGRVVDSERLPAGVECWQVAFNPHCDDSILVGADDRMIHIFRL